MQETNRGVIDFILLQIEPNLFKKIQRTRNILFSEISLLKNFINNVKKSFWV